MGLLTFVGRIVLVVANIVFMLACLALIIGGFILRYADKLMRDYFKPALDKIATSVNSINGNSNFNTDNFEFGEMVGTLATVMITVGFVLLCFCFVGCCGACCNISTVMLVYGIVLIVITVATAIATVWVLFFPEIVLQDIIESGMEDSLSEYKGLDGNNAVSLGWNWAMQKYECCGVSSYQDFDTYAPAWTGRGTYLTPAACCKTLPTTSAERTTCSGTSGNMITTIQSLNNYDKGCYSEIWDSVIVDNTAAIAPVLVIIIIAEIVMDVFAILVYKDRGLKGGLI